MDTKYFKIDYYNSTHNFIHSIGQKTNNSTELLQPGAIVLDNSNSLYIYDEKNQVIQKRTDKGDLLNLIYPLITHYTSLAIDIDNDIYINAPNLIQKYDSNGSLISTYSIDYEMFVFDLDQNSNLFIGSWDGKIQKRNLNGDIYFTKNINRNVLGIAVDKIRSVFYAMEWASGYKIEKYNYNGDLLKSVSLSGNWPIIGPMDGFANNIDTDRNGCVYVTYTATNEVAKFSPELDLIGKWGGIGKQPGQMLYPQGIAISNTDEVYISEFGNKRIQCFNITELVLIENTTTSDTEHNFIENPFTRFSINGYSIFGVISLMFISIHIILKKKIKKSLID